MTSKHHNLLNRNWMIKTQVASEFSNFNIIEQNFYLLKNDFKKSILIEQLLDKKNQVASEFQNFNIFKQNFYLIKNDFKTSQLIEQKLDD